MCLGKAVHGEIQDGGKKFKNLLFDPVRKFQLFKLSYGSVSIMRG